MNAFCVLAYPQISKEDFDLIQSFRSKYDRRYEYFNPHFTLVFPAFELNENEFVSHVIKHAEKFSKFDFCIKSATSVSDYFSNYRDVFLVPDEGNSNFIRIRDALYKDILITHLRTDIPYIPHIVIGDDIDPFFSINLANQWNEADIIIKGTILKLSIESYDGTNLKNIEDIVLK